jgi:hypothetical protein
MAGQVSGLDPEATPEAGGGSSGGGGGAQTAGSHQVLLPVALIGALSRRGVSYLRALMELTFRLAGASAEANHIDAPLFTDTELASPEVEGTFSTGPEVIEELIRRIMTLPVQSLMPIIMVDPTPFLRLRDPGRNNLGS